MTSSGKKGKAAVLEFGTQTKGECNFVLCWVKGTILGAVNKANS